MRRTTGRRPLQRTAAAWVTLGSALLAAACAQDPSKTDRRTFPSAQAAADALLDASRKDDVDALIGIFGPRGVELVKSVDPAADAVARKAFVAAASEKLVIEQTPPARAEIVVGAAAWPFPVPLAMDGNRWHFDTEAGVEEIIDRRIGLNEREMIALLRASIDAEYLYRRQDWDGDGVYEFARRYIAQPGKYDGLYWPAESGSGEPLSPLHGFIEAAGDYGEAHEAGDPWRGYRIKLLKRQGGSAEGGAQSYLDANGNLTRGFAAVAFPADYGSSGIMSFLVSHHGVIFERDLGADTNTIVEGMDAFQPEGWTVVEPAQ